jgi:hypothetical protein
MEGLLAILGLGGVIGQMVGMAGEVSGAFLGRQTHGIVFEITELLDQGLFLLVEQVLEEFQLGLAAGAGAAALGFSRGASLAGSLAALALLGVSLPAVFFMGSFPAKPSWDWQIDSN